MTFFFFTMSTQEGENLGGEFNPHRKLLISVSLGVVPNRLSYLLGTKHAFSN
jgi:hypothetical protein